MVTYMHACRADQWGYLGIMPPTGPGSGRAGLLLTRQVPGRSRSLREKSPWVFTSASLALDCLVVTVGAARAIQRCVAYRTSVCLYGGRGGTPLPIWDPAVGAEITVSVHRGGTLCCVIPQPSTRRGHFRLAQRGARNTTISPLGMAVYGLSGLHRCLPRGAPYCD